MVPILLTSTELDRDLQQVFLLRKNARMLSRVLEK